MQRDARQFDIGFRLSAVGCRLESCCCAETESVGRGRSVGASRISPFRHPPSAFPPRSGLTLIELLMVIIILTILVSAAIPIMAPTNDDRRLREASRMVNAYITGAQMKAIESQRPYGVMIKRLSQNTNVDAATNPVHDDNAVSIELQYVEQPSPFVGFSDSSSARVAIYVPNNANWYGRIRPLVLIQFLARGNQFTQMQDGLPPAWDPDTFPDATIRPGDVIEFGGTQYELLSDRDDTVVEARFDSSTNSFFAFNTGRLNNLQEKAIQIVARPINDTGQIINVRNDDHGFEMGSVDGSSDGNNPPFWTHPVPYKIHRLPMPTSAEPLQMPDGTAIDLRASGVGINDYFYVPNIHDNPQPVVIMFAPEGRVSRLKFSVDGDASRRNLPPYDQPVVDNIFLLVGRRELTPPVAVLSDQMLDASPPNVNSNEYREAREAINWLRGESRWIGIGSQSGRVVTVENAFVNVSSPDVNGSTTPETEERRNAQIQAARGFARQMSQLGGR